MVVGKQVLDPEEWDKVLGQLLRYHQNISEEIRDIICTIRKEMKKDLVPVAEDKANYGKMVKKKIRYLVILQAVRDSSKIIKNRKNALPFLWLKIN